MEQIEPHAVPFSSKVMLDRSEYENLAAAAKKYYVQERKESKLQKALDAAMKMISELKAKVAALTAELAEYKSVRGQLNTAELEQQNEVLRNKLHRYEAVIERNSLWNLFRPSRKTKRYYQTSRAPIITVIALSLFYAWIGRFSCHKWHRKWRILLIYQRWFGIIVLCYRT